MVARARKANESFEKYRMNLKKESEWLQWRLSPAFNRTPFAYFFSRVRNNMRSMFDRRGHHAMPKKQSLGIRKRAADGTHRAGIDGTKLGLRHGGL